MSWNRFRRGLTFSGSKDGGSLGSSSKDGNSGSSTRDGWTPGTTSDISNGTHPPEIARGSGSDHHHEVVMPVRDITRPRSTLPGTPDGSMSMGADTALRIAFPVTYDIVLDQPKGNVLDEPKGPGTGEAET